MGHPRPWRSTSFAQASQKRWWPHGTSAIRASRLATRHRPTIRSTLTRLPCHPKLSWSQLRSFCYLYFCAVAFDLRSTLLLRLSYVRLSILCRSRVFQSRVFSVPGEISNNLFVPNFLARVVVKEFRKSVNIWRRYAQEFGVSLFLTHMYIISLIEPSSSSYSFNINTLTERTYNNCE